MCANCADMSGLRPIGGVEFLLPAGSGSPNSPNGEIQGAGSAPAAAPAAHTHTDPVTGEALVRARGTSWVAGEKEPAVVAFGHILYVQYTPTPRTPQRETNASIACCAC
jgi:hypothetical protein